MRLFLRGLVTAVAVLALLLVAACSDSETPTRSPDGDDLAGLETLTIESEPTWTINVRTGHRIAFHDDVAVVAEDGVAGGMGRDVIVLDAATGEERWRHGEGEIPGLDRALPVPNGSAVVGDEGDEVVLVGYSAPSCQSDPCLSDDPAEPEAGVAALDLRTGEVRWSRPTVTLPAASDQRMRIASGRHGGPLVAIGPFDAGGPQDPGAYRSMELDPATGETVWEAEGVIARWVLDDRVIALAPVGPEVPPQLRTELGVPVALDRDSGDELWRAAVEEPAGWVGAGGDHLVVTPAATPDVRHIIDLEDGSDAGRVEGLDDTVPSTVDSETGMLVFYRYGEHQQLFTQLLGTEESETEAEEPVACTGKAERTAGTVAHLGYIDCVQRDDTGEPVTVFLDRRGNEVSDQLPGTALDLTDDHYVATTLGAGIAVYARTS
ncbi:PQQ-binding-like beta-propeller repeat protein [Aeromicrobium sp. CTD01-1L150]|uniref:outer membrane protein assembly factor BamB family protein n=1 Tax=Aeromicrobium sp. CTD01-1L150 TaxID=3341830 RepID=UPI0035C0AFAD